jgi:iron complex outermembrane recepter protein
MKLFFSRLIACCSTSVLAFFTAAAWASEPVQALAASAGPHRPAALPVHLGSQWLSQQAGIVTIRQVELTPTEAGFALQLDTDGPLSDPTQQAVGNALILEFPNAVLAGEAVDLAEPAAGIAFVSVTSLGDVGVQVSITGVTAVPQVTVSPTVAGLSLAVMPGSETAAETSPDRIQVVVTATRTETPLTTVPRSVTVITREEIEQQTQLNTNLGDILGQLVPGFAPPTNRANTFGQTLRGRDVSVVIDGIPQNTNLGSIPAALSSIDPAAIERIEVIRGPNAIYGGQATGGLVNIITRPATDDPLRVTTGIGITSGLTNLREGLGYSLLGNVSARQDTVDLLTSLAWTATGYAFDAAGDRIPGDITDSGARRLNGLIRLGWEPDEQQRLQFQINYFNQQQDNDFISDEAVENELGVQKARAIPVPEGTQVIGASDQATLQTSNFSLNYRHDSLLGSAAQALLYYRNYAFQGGGIPTDGRIFGPPFDFVYQSPGQSQQLGGRLQFDTPLNPDNTLSLLWGVDYVRESSSQTFNIFDPDELDASGGRLFRKIAEVPFVPNYRFGDLGLFAQFQAEVGDRLTFNGGARYVNLSINTDDYVTFQGRPIQGGSFSASDVVFNAGAVLALTDEISLFGSFGQGFSFPDIGRVLRRPPAGFTVGSSLDLVQPQKVNNYEVGLRATWPTVQASLAGFINTSDLGLSFVTLANGAQQTVRAPQRIYGVEATVDWQPAPTWQIGSSLSWLEGENDANGDGEFLALNSITVPPLKLTAYVENETLPGWRNRLQLLYSGNRDRAFNDGIDGAPISSYLTLDYVSSLALGPGELLLSVQNLLNTQYFPVYAQYFAPFSSSSNYPGQGITLGLGYRVTW